MVRSANMKNRIKRENLVSFFKYSNQSSKIIFRTEENQGKEINLIFQDFTHPPVIDNLVHHVERPPDDREFLDEREEINSEF